MRASPKDVTGNAGETEVAAKFERLGWGVAPNPRGHDLGTDLWLMARDARLFDLGLVVGAQVKAGQSWFRGEQRDASGVLSGWWFRDDDRRHIDAWLAHSVPHLVVLHDLDSRTSYWVHVIDEAVVSTGKGAKILVPAANTLDEAHLEDLLRVAASKKPGGAWEGSAWTGATAVPPSALLRHALIVPRLIAPHPNAGHADAVTPSQAVALLVQARLLDLSRQQEAHEEVPAVDEASQSEDWDWRLFGALGRRVTADDHQPLLAVVEDAPDPARRTAATAAAAAALLEKGLADEALALLDTALAHDDAGPVDHAWLTVQQARACAEVGRREEARDLAASVQEISATHRDDVTATALAGVATSLLFSTSAWEQQDVAAVITRADTTAAWWRAQTTSRALTALTERTFWAWSRDTTVRMAAGDVANDQLFSAALTASFTGDHGAWRHLFSLLGADGLLRTDRYTDPEPVSSALETLRVSGSTDEVKYAVRRLVDDGPVQAVTVTAARLDLSRSTGTTAPADLALLEVGGDVLDAPTADRAIKWLLRTLREPTDFVTRTSPSFVIAYRLIDTLATVVPAVAPETQRDIAAQVTALPPQTDQAVATSWARVIGALPDRAWTEAIARQAGEAADSHHSVLRMPLLGVASGYVQDARQRLLNEAGTGSLAALGALGDVRNLPEFVIRTLIAGLAAKIHDQVQEAHRGAFGMGGHDLGEALALLNVWHPTLATWEPLVLLIQDAHVAGEHKRGALRRLAVLADRLPDEVRQTLLTAARTAAVQPPLPYGGFFGMNADARGSASELVAALVPEGGALGPEDLLALLGGDEKSRASAARIAGRLRRDEDVGLLLSMAQDPEPGVRAVAAMNLARMVADGDGRPAVLAGVQRAAADPGRNVPLALAHALSAATSLPAEARQVLDRLRSHASAAVRMAADEPPEP